MEDFAVTCQLVPGVPHLISGSCSSPRIFGLDFLQTPPRGDALVLLLTFGPAYTWYRDFHPTGSVPCPAHTDAFRRAVKRRLERFVGPASSGCCVLIFGQVEQLTKAHVTEIGHRREPSRQFSLVSLPCSLNACLQSGEGLRHWDALNCGISC